jgi:hypothetical protein
MRASEDELDRVLDEAIRSYVTAEPLAGLEQRVVARTQTPVKRGYGRILLAVFAAIMAVTFFWKLGSPRKPVPVTLAAVPVPEVVVKPAPVQAAAIHRRRALSLPKQAVFPTPSAVTTEEHLLLALVDDHRDQKLQVFESLQQQAEPIEIKPIGIRPLVEGEKYKGGE